MNMVEKLAVMQLAKRADVREMQKSTPIIVYIWVDVVVRNAHKWMNSSDARTNEKQQEMKISKYGKLLRATAGG